MSAPLTNFPQIKKFSFTDSMNSYLRPVMLEVGPQREVLIGLHCPALKWRLKHCLNLYCFVLFECQLLQAILSEEELKEDWICDKGEAGGARGDVEDWRWDVLYDMRIYFRLKKNELLIKN